MSAGTRIGRQVRRFSGIGVWQDNPAVPAI